MSLDIIEPFADIDWDDLTAVAAASDKVLRALDDDRAHLRELVANTVQQPNLARLCEHYDILDKIVLHDNPTGWRLRLHVFLPGYFDRPHNHRWTYTSRILHGSYTHALYGTDEAFDDEVNVPTLAARMIRTERAGSTYTLHHSMIHSVVAAPYTTSLIVRGPAVKSRFIVTDRTTGQAWWQYGAATEPPEAQQAKRMSPKQLHGLVRQLTEAGVLA